MSFYFAPLSPPGSRSWSSGAPGKADSAAGDEAAGPEPEKGPKKASCLGGDGGLVARRPPRAGKRSRAGAAGARTAALSGSGPREVPPRLRPLLTHRWALLSAVRRSRLAWTRRGRSCSGLRHDGSLLDHVARKGAGLAWPRKGRAAAKPAFLLTFPVAPPRCTCEPTNPVLPGSVWPALPQRLIEPRGGGFHNTSPDWRRSGMSNV